MAIESQQFKANVEFRDAIFQHFSEDERVGFGLIRVDGTIHIDRIVQTWLPKEELNKSTG